MYNNGNSEKIKSYSDAVDYFKDFPLYNKYIEKPKINLFKTINLLSDLPFYEELNVIKTDHAFKVYAINYSLISWKKDPIKQLETSKWSIKDLFNALLNETKDFKYQITQKVLSFLFTHIH